MIKVIFFDFWNTIATNGHEDDFEKLAEKINTKNTKNGAKGTSNPEFTEEYFWSFGEHTYMIDDTKDFYDLIPELCKRLNINEEKNAPYFKEYWNSIQKKIFILPGVMELLIKLKGKYKLAIISNTSNDAIDFVNANPKLKNMFDELVYSNNVKYIKPDKRIFEYAMNLFNCKPKECVMIGDSIDADVQGAKNAGLHAIHFKDAKQVEEELNKIL